MTISDPAREPMLDRAMPADAVPGSTIPEDTEAEIQLRDGSWVWAQVIGQRKDRNGRWCVGLRWYASPSVGGREGWYLLDSRHIRRQLNEELLLAWISAAHLTCGFSPVKLCVTFSSLSVTPAIVAPARVVESAVLRRQHHSGPAGGGSPAHGGRTHH